MLNTRKSVLFLLQAAVMVAVTLPTPLVAQPAPIPRLVVSAEDAPEALSGIFARLTSGDNSIDVTGAAWLQLEFAEFNLGEGGTLTISAEMGQSQRFTQSTLEDWNGLTAIFNGSSLTVTLSGEISETFAAIGSVVIGLPGSPGSGPETVTRSVPPSLRELLGADLQKYIPEELRQRSNENQRSICGATDDRIASDHPFVARLMPIGCTGWLFDGGLFLSAGHCIAASTQIAQFSVPPSKVDGTTVSPAASDQYRIVSSTIVHEDTGIGNDWAVFQVLPNTETDLMPIDAQKGSFQLSNKVDTATVRITGYGVDDGSTNQIQQTHSGGVTEHTAGTKSAVLRYTVDTMRGNSGSPVIVEQSESDALAIGIHTNGGCGGAPRSNAGTSFRNGALWTAILKVP